MRPICFFTCIIIFCSCIFTQTKPPEAITVQTPTSVTTTIAPSDSTYLKIKFEKDSSYNVSVMMGKSVTAKNIGLLDDYLTANNALIDIEKVMVYTPADKFNTKLMKLIPVLQKHNIQRFKIITDEPR